MLSRKSKDKSKEGVVGVGKYVKKDTPPEIPGMEILYYSEQHASIQLSYVPLNIVTTVKNRSKKMNS